MINSFLKTESLKLTGTLCALTEEHPYGTAQQNLMGKGGQKKVKRISKARFEITWIMDALFDLLINAFADHNSLFNISARKIGSIRSLVKYRLTYL